MSIKLLSQRDPKWANVKLGNSNVTIGQDGCLITSLCMLSQYYGVPITPDVVARHTESFNANGEYLWNYPFPFTLEKSIGGKIQPTRNDAEIMKSLKGPRRGVVLQVDNGEHFMLALSKPLFGSYTCADPWFGDKCDAVKRWKNITGSRHLLIK